VIFAPSRLVGRAAAEPASDVRAHLDEVTLLVSTRTPHERWAFASGWAWVPGSDARRSSVRLFLRREDESEGALFTTNRFRRRDVAEVLAEPGAEDSGFQALIPLASLAPGVYRVGACVGTPAARAWVDLARDLVVPAAGERGTTTPKLVSVHVPKTGGESVLQTLQDLYPGRVFRDTLTEPLLPLRLRIHRAPWTRVARHLVPEDADCIHGHFLATKYERSFPAARTAMWFREPAERLVSDFHYIRRTPMLFPAHSLQRDIQNGSLDLEGFVRHRLYRDLQSTYLDGRSLETLDFVGIQEHFDRSMELFQRVIGTHADLAGASRNANPMKPVGEAYENSPALRSLVERHHLRDTALFPRALRRFEELCRIHGVA
jgi:hypothetical protein